MVDTAAAEREPHLVWNAFVDVLAMEDYADLSAVQRQAYLVFWYESEVQNGGHLQYFANRGIDRLPETLAALSALGLSSQAEVLQAAGLIWIGRARKPLMAVEEYVGEALGGVR